MRLLIGGLSLIAWAISIVLAAYQFDKECGDYLKLAGDAPTIQRADEFLGKALEYMERKHLTAGNSALIFSKPTTDVGIWYGQIKGAKENTAILLMKEKEAPESVSQLEKDNALMKIREVLLDDSSEGTAVTLPTLISWFPYQWIILLWGAFSVILCISVFVPIGSISTNRRSRYIKNWN